MADKIVTAQKLKDADKDCDALDQAVSGGDSEYVKTRRGKEYPTMPNAIRQIMENGGFMPFATEAELLTYVPNINPSAAKAMDTKKVWLWKDDKWNDTGFSELEQAKVYTDSILKDVTILPSGSLNAAKNLGNYLLTTSNTYTDLPPMVVLDEPVILKVAAMSNGFFEQQLNRLNSPTIKWARSCRVSDGVGIWRSPAAKFIGLVDSVDPTSLTIDGGYVLTNGINLPKGFSGTALVDIVNDGGFKTVTVKQTNGRNKFEKVGGGNWIESMPFALTNDRFPSDFNFRGLFTDADCNSCLSEGNYLLNGKYINGPKGFDDTLKINVGVYGSFIVHRATSTKHNGGGQERQSSIINGIRVWTEWSASEVVGASSIAGKSIAFIGDSIVEQGDYPERIGARYGATVYKFGFGGCRASYYPSNLLGYDKQCLYNISKCINTGDYSSLIAGAEYTRDNYRDDNTPQANAMAALDWSKVDILVIAFGTNDWTGNPIGTDLVADSEGKTFKGALCYSIEQIQAKYPHIQIVLIGMSFRLRADGNPDHNSDNTATSYGYLKEYQQAIVEVGEKYHLPTYDMYKNSGVNNQNHAIYLRDGVHPTADKGNQHWASKIGSFLSSNV